MKVKRATPVLFVDSVAATRDFFKRAGFKATAEVPDGKSLGFAILDRDGAQLMLESRDSSNEHSDELTYLEPGGHLVTFAQFA